MKTHPRLYTHITKTILVSSIAVTFSACGGSEDGKSAGNCPLATTDLTAQEQAHFNEFASMYTLYAEDKMNVGDGLFVHGTAYTFTVSCNGNATLTTAGGTVEFTWQSDPQNRVDVYAHESNTFYHGAGYTLLWQYDRQDDEHFLSYTATHEGAQQTWQLTKAAPMPRPKVLTPAEQLMADGLGAILGETSLVISRVRRSGGGGGAVPEDFPFAACDTLKLNVDDNLVVSVVGTTDAIDPRVEGQSYMSLPSQTSGQCNGEPHARLQWGKALEGDGFRRVTAYVQIDGAVCAAEVVWTRGKYTPIGQNTEFLNEVIVTAAPSADDC